MTADTYTFTEAQKVDLRRYMGYPSFGNQLSGFQAYRFFQAYGTLEFRLNNSTTEEGNEIVNNYLVTLKQLETNLVSANANLSTDQAAVWTRNKSELPDRWAEYNKWRRQLCDFLGLPPGPGLAPAGTIRLVI